MENNNQIPFRILTLLVFCALLLPVMVKEGMFIDGLLYSSVSHNLANGIGTFWFPLFDQIGSSMLKTFHEQPPLYFALQSIFFRIFGDGYFVEKLFSLTAAIVTAFIIMQFWNKINKSEPRFRKLAWLPVLLWIIIPIVFYIYQHSLIEGTQSVFTVAAVYFCWLALTENRRILLRLFLSGIFVFLATFTKGIPGFFPVVAPALFWVLKRELSITKMLTYTLIIFLVPVVIYGLMTGISDQAYTSLSFYVNERLLDRISRAPTVSNRFHVMGQWVLKMLPVFIITFIVFAVNRFKFKGRLRNREFIQNIIFFMLVGFSGTVPLMLTLVQKSFYFVPALPFFAIGFALLLAPVILPWISGMGRIVRRVLTIVFISGLIIVLGYSASVAGKPGRDADMLHDIHRIGSVVPDHSIVGIPKSLHKRWTLKTYMVRYYYITLDSSGDVHEYLMTPKDTNPAPGKWRKVQLSLREFSLFKLKGGVD